MNGRMANCNTFFNAFINGSLGLKTKVSYGLDFEITINLLQKQRQILKETCRLCCASLRLHIL